MKKETKILELFPNASFWDLEVSKLDIMADKDLIIPRALFISNAQTIKTVFTEKSASLKLRFKPLVHEKSLV